jgi:protein TonB
MFDLISGGPRHPFHNPTMAPQIVSGAIHLTILSVVLVLPLLYAADKLPALPAMMAFVAPTAAAPPPPPPPPPRANRSEAKPLPVPTSGQMAAPLEAPTEIAPEPASPGLEAFGVEGGVEGGLVGGVAGGIVGGLVSMLPPPPPPPPPQPAPKVPVRIGGQIQAPALIRRVEPVYPDIAVLAKVSGIVILEAVVAADGSVESVRVLRSVKFLDGPATDAVKQWRYSPLVLNGEPTPFVLTVTLTFSIKTSS